MKIRKPLPPGLKEILLQDDLQSFKTLALSRGAIYGQSGKSILHYAAKYCNQIYIPHYCIHDLKIKLKTCTKKTKSHALQISCIYGKTEIAKYLLSFQDQSLEDCDSSKETLLSLAVKHNHFDLAVHIINKGAKVTPHNLLGWTPIHWSANNGNLKMTEYLLNHGADPRALNNDCENSLHLAAESGSIETLSFLLNFVSPLVISKKGTLLHHTKNNSLMIEAVLRTSSWAPLPKLPVLLEIKAPVQILIKHCASEVRGRALGLVLNYDREDFLKKLYFKYYITELVLAELTTIQLLPRCSAAVEYLSKWQSIKKILYVHKHSRSCVNRLPTSLLIEIFAFI